MRETESSGRAKKTNKQTARKRKFKLVLQFLGPSNQSGKPNGTERVPGIFALVCQIANHEAKVNTTKRNIA